MLLNVNRKMKHYKISVSHVELVETCLLESTSFDGISMTAVKF